MASLISQANSWHQMKETKQLKPPQNPKWLPTWDCLMPIAKYKVEKHKNKQTNKKPKSQRSNRLLSATKEQTNKQKPQITTVW